MLKTMASPPDYQPQSGQRRYLGAMAVELAKNREVLERLAKQKLGRHADEFMARYDAGEDADSLIREFGGRL